MWKAGSLIAGKSRKCARSFAVENVKPEYVRKLVEDAVAYAERYGLRPHSGYATAKLLFGDIDASACLEAFEYGVHRTALRLRPPR